ncbi:MAG: O-succinylhomoserine sulfhydrylase [Devosia sp.]|jgi:O-succinylhomoserine sulfhydrylase|uniref:O-succinylhomoserine sulfhydrylase n=1 Tax=unclassified Devosia TaxID=196773 RepID=UPI001A074DC7|nr:MULTISPECIES: O-succinylhomoserine sulfhydrylase [unclassified Devosia]MBF0679499.1 O-succinylhomoserine sulfhydrylase [Devosia sp.]WEJ33885.1 O-succinylhomoserine sulfhydrylase [Devosia sp. SD17-2]
MSKAQNPLLDPRQRSAATQMVHGGGKRTAFNETSEALFLNSGYSYPSSEHAELLFQNKIEGGHNYSRFANPTMDMFQDRMALLEGAEAARAFATGMAAVTNAIMSQVRAGDHIVAAQALFGGCRYVVEDYAPRFGVESTLVDGRDPENFARAMRPNTKVVFIETPTNPTLELVDIAAVAEIAHAHGAKLIVDNVFSTALWQKPLELGADIVTYSATKHIDGQGRVLGGVVLGSKEIIEGDVHTFLRQTGATLSPFNAWVLVKGLETYALRVKQMTDSAEKIANALAAHPKIARVAYPHHPSHPQYDLAKRQMKRGSTLMAIDLKGGQEAAFTFSDSLAVVLISNNLGDSKSLITHPRTTTHARLTEEVRLETGVTPGLLRLSVGLEDPDDLIADLMYGLDQV